LKPANIKIRPDGSVKVLDFGLAKASEPAGATLDSPTMTITMTVTNPGAIMGTPAYMPPEQVRGEKVDKRADIWAFGVVLYEIVTGHRPFEGKTVSDIMAAVLKEEPDWDRVPVKTRRLLRRCLEKDPRVRLRDAGDAMALLDESGHTLTAPSQSWLGFAGWAAAGVFALAAAALAFVHFREKPPESLVTRTNIDPPERTRFASENFTPPAVSPDGRQVVFLAVSDEGRAQLWLRSLDSLASQPLTGTDHGSHPFWSPDSKSIGFFAAGKLKKMDISGGRATILADASSPRGGTWSQNGIVVFAPTAYGFQEVSASGGAARPVTTAGVVGTARRFPSFLPDGNHFLYLFGSPGSDYYSIRIGSLDSPAEDRALPGAVDGMAVYAEGYLLFVQGTTLVARPFNVQRLAFTGDAVAVVEHIQSGGIAGGPAKVSVSGNGVLVYRSNPIGVRLNWFDRTGKSLGTVSETGDIDGVHFSPDHRIVAAAVREASGGNVDIWLYDLFRGLPTRFTFNPANDSAPVWSPDGGTIVFQSSRSGHFDLYRKPADGSRNEELLYSDTQQKYPTSFSPDGRFLAYETIDSKNGFDIWLLPDPLISEKERALGALNPYPFVQTEFNEQGARFSPDGHWIAYESNESGRSEVYVSTFPHPGGKRRISTAGGEAARWRPDGRELFYVAPDNRLMAAEVDTRGGSVEMKKVDPLFGPVTTGYDVSSDGQKFLVLVHPEGETGGPLTIVQNWTAGLKK
jgi:Tol biopolymer transport system component